MVTSHSLWRLHGALTGEQQGGPWRLTVLAEEEMQSLSLQAGQAAGWNLAWGNTYPHVEAAGSC